MQGMMMDVPLLISSLIKHADRYHGDTEIVSRMVEDGSIHRYTYRDAHRRSRQLANALTSLARAIQAHECFVVDLRRQSVAVAFLPSVDMGMLRDAVGAGQSLAADVEAFAA